MDQFFAFPHGDAGDMQFRKVIKRQVGEESGSVAGTVHAVIAATIGNSESGAPPVRRSRVSSRQRVVQRNGRTVVDETEVHTDEEGHADA